MRGDDRRSGSLFSYVDLEARVPRSHPLRVIRTVVDDALQELHGLRSERQMMERLDVDLLFRWFVGLGIDDPVWQPTVYAKNRDRLF